MTYMVESLAFKVIRYEIFGATDEIIVDHFVVLVGHKYTTKRNVIADSFRFIHWNPKERTNVVKAK